MASNHTGHFLNALLRSRKYILWVTGFAAIFSIVVSLLIPNYYRSTTEFYAASPDLGKAEKIFGLSGESMQYFGSEDDRERLISLAKSTEVGEFLIDSFDLFEYYDIDPDSKAAGTKVQKQLREDLKVLKTESDGIRLSMVHQNPETARDIAQVAREYIENRTVRILRDGQRRIITSFESSLVDKKGLLRYYGDTLQSIQTKYGIIDPETQSEILSTLVSETEAKLSQTRARLNALEGERGVSRDSIIKLRSQLKGYERKMELLTSEGENAGQFTNIKKFQSGLTDFKYFKKMYEGLQSDLSNELRRLEFYRSAVKSNPPGIHLIEEAQVPDTKAKPFRTMIVFISTLAGLIFSILAVIALESYRQYLQ